MACWHLEVVLDSWSSDYGEALDQKVVSLNLLVGVVFWDDVARRRY
jgi:hypothetical protein